MLDRVRNPSVSVGKVTFIPSELACILRTPLERDSNMKSAVENTKGCKAKLFHLLAKSETVIQDKSARQERLI